MVEPTATIDNVRVQVQQNNGTEFVDYWRSRPLSFVAGTPIDVAINPFIDLFGNTQYRLIATSVDGDVVVRGNAAGAPRLIIDYRNWEDRDLATQAYVGEYRFDNTVEIAANVTITSANLETYNRKIWLVTGSGTKDVIISDGIDLNFLLFMLLMVAALSGLLTQEVGRLFLSTVNPTSDTPEEPAQYCLDLQQTPISY